MKNHFYLLILICFIIFTNCSNNANLAEAFVAARNAGNISKIEKIIDKNYHETFGDTIIDIKDKNHLFDNIRWGVELESKTTIVETLSVSDTAIVTVEENINYKDIVLKGRPRKFKITYHIKNGIILKQQFDSLPGHHETFTYNNRFYDSLILYCEKNQLGYPSADMNQEGGKYLKKLLEAYATGAH